eukprot:CAMPEP_0119560852 /NCGR_PEP_ID=MMETSP1352-20130426/16035_1 /TAXON_ID=265584 /ORGANISM="Stauroneis constricta, Strain CCMP1120" /LENGTH=215 /DNA_ID=CAMNT_0007608913 /DNA_START=83 /DNA_END=727 /DNA_ORIENTATION=-
MTSIISMNHHHHHRHHRTTAAAATPTFKARSLSPRRVTGGGGVAPSQSMYQRHLSREEDAEPAFQLTRGRGGAAAKRSVAAATTAGEKNDEGKSMQNNGNGHGLNRTATTPMPKKSILKKSSMKINDSNTTIATAQEGTAIPQRKPRPSRRQRPQNARNASRSMTPPPPARGVTRQRSTGVIRSPVAPKRCSASIIPKKAILQQRSKLASSTKGS